MENKRVGILFGLGLLTVGTAYLIYRDWKPAVAKHCLQDRYFTDENVMSLS